MIKYPLVLLALILVSCSKSNVEQGPAGVSPTVTVSNTSLSNCPNGGFAITVQDQSHESVNYVCNGAPGLNGEPGTSSTTFMVPATPAECPTGGVDIVVNDTNISQYTSICNGATGPTGAAGTPGVDASGTTTVQFCSGYTTTYPSSFPEYGICINNSLYGVYYDGQNAWLAQIAPGQYSSTSTSAPCNFTVKSNCEVTND